MQSVRWQTQSNVQTMEPGAVGQRPLGGFTSAASEASAGMNAAVRARAADWAALGSRNNAPLGIDSDRRQRSRHGDLAAGPQSRHKLRRALPRWVGLGGTRGDAPPVPHRFQPSESSGSVANDAFCPSMHFCPRRLCPQSPLHLKGLDGQQQSCCVRATVHPIAASQSVHLKPAAAAATIV